MAKQPVDLFQVALGMDPRFGENLPKDVADAFASGDVARVFRTSADLSPKSIPHGSVPMASQAGRIDGDYGGSIYVQNRSGKTARWKQSGDEDYGWNANQGQGSFYDNAVRIDTDSFDDSVAGLMRSGTPSAQAKATVAEKMGTPLVSSSAQDMLGEKLVEYQYKDNGKRVSAHPGHEITDVVESTGERHYFKGDPSSPRGVKSVEPVSDYMARKGIQTPAMEVRDKGDALAAEVASNKGDALAEETGQDQQEVVQEDLQASAGESGAETLQDTIKEKAQEKAQEIAEDKAKETVTELTDVDGGKPKETPKGKVRVRKASTARFHHSNYSVCSLCSQCCQCCYSTSCCS
jgi:hypothetical protein